MTKNEWIAKPEYLARTSKDLTGDCLLALEEIGSNVLFTYQHPSFLGNPFGPEILAGIREAQRRKALKDAVRHLREQRYIVNRQEGVRIVSEITTSGEIRALKARIRSTTNKMLPEGEYCIVTFDIPEDAKMARNTFRAMLRSFGFQQHHLSVWTKSADVCREMNQLIKSLGVQRWVTVFRGSVTRD